MNKLPLLLIGLITIINLCIGIYHFKKPEEAKIGYVDIKIIFEEYEGSKEYQNELEEYKNSQQFILDSLKTAISSFEKTETNESRYNKLITEYNQKLANLGNQIQSRDNHYSSSILNQINSFIQLYGKENNYDIIHGTIGDGNLMYARPEFNLTNEIIKELNKEYAGL